MLVADGPYSSNPEAIRKQYQELINIISEMNKKRSECPEALSDTRWLQMEQALQERKTKLNSLLIESERFWEEIGSVTQDLATIDEEIASQQPPSVIEGMILQLRYGKLNVILTTRFQIGFLWSVTKSVKVGIKYY